MTSEILPHIHWIDITLLIAYACLMVMMGIIHVRKARTAAHFMVAGRSIPAWAAGIAVMSTYTSSISCIATPGKAFDADKFSLGSTQLSLTTRTVWFMIIYGITENLRNLLADKNYVQKVASVTSKRDAKRSIWISMAIYIPLTALFLYIGTTLFAFYAQGGLGEGITKGT